MYAEDFLAYLHKMLKVQKERGKFKARRAVFEGRSNEDHVKIAKTFVDRVLSHETLKKFDGLNSRELFLLYWNYGKDQNSQLKLLDYIDAVAEKKYYSREYYRLSHALEANHKYVNKQNEK